MKFNAIIQSESLHELEAYTTSRKMIVRICIVSPLAFRIATAGGNISSGTWWSQMMKSIPFLCISNFLYGFNTAI